MHFDFGDGDEQKERANRVDLFGVMMVESSYNDLSILIDIKKCVHHGFTKPSVPHSSRIRPVTEYGASHTSDPPSPEPKRIDAVKADSNSNPTDVSPKAI
ncbi:hypothetical protein AB1N83_010650 [Pleurotus pulmonarius]